ncbi:hypothetical protein OH77DRAFT_1424287 [Trametes cingulata]|nr:hypothetical protein OH77DRAFT_1424287 [Trametes cingulata]
MLSYSQLPAEADDEAKPLCAGRDCSHEVTVLAAAAPQDRLGLWTLSVLLLFLINTVVLTSAAVTFITLHQDLETRLEAIDTRALPRPDPLYGLMP